MVRNLFAVGDVFDATEDGGSIEGNVSENDQGEGLTFALADGSTMENGTLEFNADGSFIYTPNPDFHGTDSVTYVATQMSTGETATAQLTVDVENDFETLEEYGWSLAWSDEFDGASVDNSLWMGVNASIVDGNLVLTAEEGVTSALSAISGMTSGRVEARVQVPAGAGLSSAFGLLPMADVYEGENALTVMEADEDGLIRRCSLWIGVNQWRAI